MAQAMPTVSADLALSASESRQAFRVGAAAAGDRRDHDEAGDDAGDRNDLDAVARHRGNHQREADPEDVAHDGVGEAERDAGAEDQRDRERKSHAAGIERREALEQHVDQRRERQHQVPARHQRFPGARDLRALHADEAVLASLQMHHPERRGEIEDRRDHRGLDDLRIGHAERLGHDEGDRSHDGRHDLAAHRSGGLDAGGEGAAIAELDHQGDRELADGNDVGDARTRDRAHHARSEHRDLGGAAAGAAEQAERDVGEQLDHAGAFQERAEQDEQEDVGCRDVDRHAVEALGAEREMGDDLVEVIAAVIERRRQILAEEPVQQTGAAHQRQRRPHQPPRALEDQDREQRADREVHVGRIAIAGDQVGIEDPLVEPAEEPGGADDPTHRAAEIGPGGEIADQAEGQEDQEADMDAAHHLARQVVESRDIELEHRKRETDGIGQMPPGTRAEAFRKAMLEIVEFNLDGLLALNLLLHMISPPPCQRRLYPLSPPTESRDRKNAPRHCERSEAIHRATRGEMDCFVASLLAMTARSRRSGPT
ncbi:hypothetical protein ACVI1L_003627 [Bradyrhizobium sp. USDA 4516]